MAEKSKDIATTNFSRIMEKLRDHARIYLERNGDYFEYKQLLKTIIQFFKNLRNCRLKNYRIRYVRRVLGKKTFFIFQKNLWFSRIHNSS